MHDNEVINSLNQPSFFYGWYLVAASWMSMFLVSAVAFSIFFKPILEEFKLDRATLSLVQTTVILIFAIFSPLIGRLIDRFGPRIMLSAGIAVLSLSSVISGLATSLWQLYIGRFLFEMRPLPAAQVLINRWFDKKRGRALGIFSTGLPIGAIVLSPISQYLVLSWGWRITLLFWAGVSFLVLSPLILLIRDNPKDKGCLPDGEILYRDIPIKPAPGIKADTPGVKSNERRGSSFVEAARTGSFWLLSASHIICGVGCGFMMTHIVIFATDVGYSDMVGASLLSVQGGVNLVGLLLTGYMSDRIARNRVLAMTHLIRSISFITIVIFVTLGGGSLWILYVAMVFFGFGWFTTAPLTSGLVADMFGYMRMGTMLGLILSCHAVGTALGSYAGGITYEMTGSYHPFFMIQGILEFMAAVFAFAIKKRNLRKAM